jgi:hypothetical protein
MYLSFIALMVSETPVVLLCLMKTPVLMMTQTWTLMTGKTNQSLYEDDLLHHVYAPCSPCYSPSCGPDSYVSSSCCSRSELDDRSFASSGSFPKMMILTSRRAVMLQVVSTSMVTISLIGWAIQQWSPMFAIQQLKKKKTKRRKSNVNLWFESNNTLLIYSHICLFLLPQACILGCCDCHIAILCCLYPTVCHQYQDGYAVICLTSSSRLVILSCMQCTPLNPYSSYNCYVCSKLYIYYS